jgi:hypothetical protein
MRISASIAERLELDQIRLRFSYPQYNLNQMYSIEEMAIKDEKLLEIKDKILEELEIVKKKREQVRAQLEEIEDTEKHLMHNLTEIKENHGLLVEALARSMKNQLLKLE